MLLSGPIRMEGMQCFASKIRNFCMPIGCKTLTNTKLSSFELLSIFDLASCFFIPNVVFCIQKFGNKISRFGHFLI